jgi:hypothetical protein
MNSKMLGGVVVIIVVVLGIWAYSASKENEIYTGGEQNPQDTTSLGMYAEENALVPSDQKPGNSVTVNAVLMNQPGYVVVHESTADQKPGAVIGTSALLQKGEHSQVVVALNRASKNGEMLHVMIHAEQGGDTTFDATADTAVESSLGGPITAYFMVDANASEVGEVLP